MLEAAARGRRVAGSSSPRPAGAIYGEGDGRDELPLRRDAPLEPLSAYGQSKFAAEGYLALYERLYGLSGVSAAPRQRLRAAAGPARRGGRGRDLLRAGARRRPAHRLRRRRRRPATTYTWPTWSAALLAAERKRRSGPINVGTGIETTVLELAERVGELGGARATSSPSSRRRAPARCSASSIDPAAAAARAGLARRALDRDGARCRRSRPTAESPLISPHACTGLRGQGVRLPVPPGICDQSCVRDMLETPSTSRPSS